MPSAMSDAGKPVDWWFMYKVSGRAQPTSNQPASGGGSYVYYDADMATRKEKLVLSPNRVDQRQGALFNTLGQLYGPTADKNKGLGWFFYNDEDPITGKVSSSAGHTKGVLAFDVERDTAFWLVHSTPLFPGKETLEFPDTGLAMAQTFLCITLKDVKTARALAEEMYSAHRPHVYACSTLPTALSKDPRDWLVLLMNHEVSQDTRPMTAKVPFTSKAGQAFYCIAKNKYWGEDFYNDLVGPALHENLEVETWEHGSTPGSADSIKQLTVTAMKGVDLSPIGIPSQWSEENDHAKLAISGPSGARHWVCVGDINFTKAQEKRGGGTVSFLCAPLWDELIKILDAQVVVPVAKSKVRTATG